VIFAARFLNGVICEKNTFLTKTAVVLYVALKKMLYVYIFAFKNVSPFSFSLSPLHLCPPLLNVREVREVYNARDT
jgi:hypothetical protein